MPSHPCYASLSRYMPLSQNDVGLMTIAAISLSFMPIMTFLRNFSLRTKIVKVSPPAASLNSEPTFCYHDFETGRSKNIPPPPLLINSSSDSAGSPLHFYLQPTSGLGDARPDFFLTDVSPPCMVEIVWSYYPFFREDGLFRSTREPDPHFFCKASLPTRWDKT